MSNRSPNPTENESQKPDAQDKTTTERVDKQSDQSSGEAYTPKTDLSDKEARGPNMK